MLSCRQPNARCWLNGLSLSSLFLTNCPGPTPGQPCYDLLKSFSAKVPKKHDPTPAFAFDIDGVLKRGSEVISARVDLPRVWVGSLSHGQVHA